MFDIDEKLNSLIQRSFSEELPRSDQKILADWIADKLEHKHYYLQLKNLYLNTGIPEPEHIPDLETSWNELENRLSGKEQKEKIIGFHESDVPKKNRYTKFSLAIAAILIIFLTYITILQQDQWNMEITDSGEQSEVMLSDKSTVMINSGSFFEYPDAFSDSIRLVRLNGQAFFDITNATKPFIVETNNAKIKVLGTRFDVYSRYNRTEVIVEEGKVMLFSTKAHFKKHLLLKSDQMGIVNENKEATLAREENADYLIGWLDNRFVFHKTPLGEAIEELERRHNVAIRITDDILKNKTMSGSFEDLSVDSTLEAFCLALNLTLSKEGNLYVISR